MSNGWIKLYRGILESDVFQNERLLKVWIWCLCKASHKEHTQLVGHQLVTLQPGQFIFGRKAAAESLKIKESSLWRDMKLLEQLGNLDIKSNNKFSVITIGKWAFFQGDTPEVEQQMNNKWTTNEQQMDTNKNVKNEKNAKNDNRYSSSTREIVAYLNEMTGSHYKPGTRKTQDLIKARMNEGFTVDDFKTVIWKKTKEWKNDPKMVKFLRPETLFGNKFEGYLNQKERGRLDWIFEMGGGSDDTELF